ncbi:MAG: hypothetical protein HY293_09095 [Planctomycetes bacterium]|nr:hypothetical protein [Planctomycetota bacterium]
MRTIGVLTLILCLAACSSSGTVEGPVTAQEAATPERRTTTVAGCRVSGPYTFANLGIFLLHDPGVARNGPDYLILEEALQAKTLLVTEKGDAGQVNTLEVQNSGDRPVFLQAGDTVKGGKQDRTIAVDLVLPPRSGKQDVAAFCVEPGRWSGRPGTGAEGGARYANVFGAAGAPVATREQKLAVKLAQNQSKVWEEGRKVNRDLAGKAPSDDSRSGSAGNESYVLAAEKPAVETRIQAYVDALLKVVQGREDAVGMACAVNGEATTLELYSDPGLFRKLWPKLLRSASLEALSKETGAAPGPEATPEDLKRLLAQASDGKTRSQDLPEDVRLETIDSARRAVFETRVKGRLLHRQVLTK